MIVEEAGLNAIRDAIGPMLNNRLDNYIVPGLASELVGGGAHGKVRLFTATRQASDFVTPHSHRFDFTCLVLDGRVENTIFTRGSVTADEWCESTIGQVCGPDGLFQYVHKRANEPTRYAQVTNTYGRGQAYSMRYDEIHSIRFQRGSKVLFFEGPQVIDQSTMIEPWVNGKVVPTFKTEAWMFEKDGLGKTESRS